MRILLAEDSAASRFLLRHAVEELGHECIVAEDGLRAWELFRRDHAEVVISDWIMPGLDGDELCRRIRADARSAYTYFVMLTSLEDKEFVLRGMQAGVDDYLTKPLDRNDLAARLIAASRVTALHHQIAEQQRELENEVAMAAGIQRGLLPAEPPQVAGAELAGVCLPAANIGGDYYDFLLDEQGRLVLLIADVAGHSIGSALLMAMARSVLRREVAEGALPAAVLGATNRAMYADLVTAGLFITMFCVIYDPADGRLTFANAGHNPPLLQRPDAPGLELDADGAAIGFLEDVEFEERTETLGPGDALLLYTDGAVEAQDPRGEQFGEERLADLVAAMAPAGSEALVRAVVDTLNDFTGGAHQGDDITVVALRRTSG
ncbi:MAG: phosphoserine phosphatase RsbU/P [Solirubrobacteraceae bacterium]|jgi:serine phosphatase RsbU (regulator of sigma subunit)|nr:phosphoserine phosphatase RsbU/P [Solirubrobacteraceae bacterium]